MHLYITTRGIKHDVDRFINDLQAQYMPWKRHDAEWKLQLSVRPIQLWELVVPEDTMPILINTFWPDGAHTKMRKEIALQMKALQIAIGAKKIPKFDVNDKRAMMLYKQNVAIYPIGVRHDKRDENGNEII